MISCPYCKKTFTSDDLNSGVFHNFPDCRLEQIFLMLERLLEIQEIK